MALKIKITKEQFEKLPADIKTEYKLEGDIYVLDVSDLEDTGALKRAKDREAQLRKDAEARAKVAEDKLAELDNSDARKKGDIETLEKSWKAKLDAKESELTGKLSKLQEATKRSLLDSTAMALATKISTVPSLMSRVIAERLMVDFDGDVPVLRILDKEKKVSTLSIDDLSKEFVDNKEYSSILIGSKASGGGAPTGRQPARLFGGAGSSDDKPVNLATADPRMIAQAIKERKEAEAK